MCAFTGIPCMGARLWIIVGSVGNARTLVAVPARPPGGNPPAAQAVQLTARPAAVVALWFPPGDQEPRLHLAHESPP